MGQPRSKQLPRSAGKAAVNTTIRSFRPQRGTYSPAGSEYGRPIDPGDSAELGVSDRSDAPAARRSAARE